MDSFGVFKKISNQTFVQDGVGGLVSRQTLLAQVLVRLRQTLHLAEALVERHGRVVAVLGNSQVRSSSQLLLYDQGLLQQLVPPRQELVLSKLNKFELVCYKTTSFY